LGWPSPNAPLLIGGASLVGGLPPRAPAGLVAPRESPSVGRRWAGQWVGGSKAKTHRQAYPPNPMGRWLQGLGRVGRERPTQEPGRAMREHPTN
jgi:hypothetical protein